MKKKKYIIVLILISYFLLSACKTQGNVNCDAYGKIEIKDEIENV